MGLSVGRIEVVLDRGDGIDRPSRHISPIDYATPARPATRSMGATMSAFLAVVGTVSAVLGGLMLVYGGGGIVWLVREWSRVDGQDVLGVAVFNLIGALCGLFGVRWVWGAVRRYGGDPRAW